MAGFHERISRRLFSHLDPDQADYVFAGECDIFPDFLGFVDIYRALSGIIPRHFTVVDLGCAYAPQSWYFRGHLKYIGVDIMCKRRFSQPNTEHHNMATGEFVRQFASGLNLDQTFAICSYVPPWGHENSIEIARATFPNVFTYYLSGDASAMVRI